MIRHILLVRTGAAGADQLPAVLDELVQLAATLPGVLEAAAGPSRSPEDLERGYTHGLSVDFADRAALLNYGENAEHQALGRRITDLAEGGVDGILVVDLEFPAL